MFHPTEEDIETYLQRRVTGARINETIEEHLLGCPMCLDWAQSQEHVIRLMRDCLLCPIPKRERKATAMAAGWLF